MKLFRALPLLLVILHAPVVTLHLLASVQVPNLTGPVMDEANLLQGHEKSRLTAVLTELRSSKRIEAVIYITPSLQGLDIESFSLAVAEKWQLGHKGKDEGLLIVIAPNERRMRFEVGYGLEGTITDAFSKRIQTQILVPYFREKRYGDGLLLAVEAIGQKLGIAVDTNVSNPIPVRQGQRNGIWSFLGIILLFIFFLPGVLMLMTWNGLTRGHFGKSYSGGWGGGWWGGRGGSGWGGGGGFGGGGASSSW